MALSKEYYGNLSAEELAQDDFFIKSVQQETIDTGFWNEFLHTYPNKRDTFDEAIALVQSLRFSNDKPATGAKERIWNSIKEETSRGKLVSIRNSKKWIWAAAAIAIMIVCSVTWLITMNGQKHTTMATAFGQTRQVVLPDQSVVMLNANSSIEFDPQWDGKTVREVWLKGEAFFDVKHLHQQGAIKESDRFIVHAGNTAIEVLGTSFNVSERKQMTKVVLQTGSVRVDFADKEIASIMMKPGEMMQYDQQAKKAKKESTQLEKHVAWKKKELLLNNTSMPEIISVIENTFGYTVEVNSDEIMSKQLSAAGTVSLENEEDLFRSLELILNVKIITRDKTLYIESK